VSFTIIQTTADNWERVRDLRLEMLADTPLAYIETLETARGHSEQEWRMRGARGSLVAVDDATGRWVGSAGVVISNAVPLLVGVYVSPSHRGRELGVLAALVARVEEWSRAHGGTLALRVHEDNPRARRAYERLGFALTGATFPYELDATQREVEMVKLLD
jgi:GNAT superfamily N-acetyltransferase